jgi:hypothetical protein
MSSLGVKTHSAVVSALVPAVILEPENEAEGREYESTPAFLRPGYRPLRWTLENLGSGEPNRDMLANHRHDE